ncbi:MAG: peptidylprolyl isomerase [Pseudomonadota bacterium]
MRTILLSLCLISSLVQAGELLDRIVAIIDDDTIMLSELGREAQALSRQLRENNTDPMPDRDQILSTALDQMISDKLYLNAASRLGISVNEQDVTRTTMQLSQQNNLSLLRFRSKLTEEGIDFDQFQEHIRNRLIINRLIGREVISQIQVSKNEVEQELSQQPARQQPDIVIPQIAARHILIQKDLTTGDREAREQLQQLRNRIMAGEDFALLARTHSADPGSADKGGELGWVNPDDMVSEFAAQMKNTPINQISQPFKTRFGWHIVQVLDKREHNDTQQQTRQIVREKIQMRKAEEARQAYLQRLRAEAYIEIRSDDNNLPGA